MTSEKKRVRRDDNVVEQKKKKKKKIILFAIEVVILLVVVGVYFVAQKFGDNGPIRVEIQEENIVVNTAVAENESLNGYRNIALFGVDSRDGALGKGTLSDTIMVASISEDTYEVKLVSIYRDTYLNIGNDTYNKANQAYNRGGPEQGINMLNMNLDLNITDYVTVGFAGVIEAVDMLGGVMLDIQSNEISYLNDYQYTMAEELKRSYTPIETAGYQRVNGMQAMAYCRIRYTLGDDFKRTERQRDLMIAMSEEAKKASVTTLNNIANEVFGYVATSLTLEEILGLMSALSKYSIVDSGGFPFANEYITESIHVGSSIVPTSLEENIIVLHEFLFGETAYEVSEDAVRYSKQIESDTSKYMN